MGKIIDFIFTNNWEEFQRIQLYKKIGNSQLIKGNQPIKIEEDEWEGERTVPTIEELEENRLQKVHNRVMGVMGKNK